MASRASRWPGNDTPLSRIHGGTAANALRAIKASRAMARDIAGAIIARNLSVCSSNDRRRPSAGPRPGVSGRPLKAFVRPAYQKHCRSDTRFRQVKPLIDRTARPSRDQDVCSRHREMLFKAQDGQCALCGQVLDFAPKFGSLDHCLPLSEGGRDHLGNLVLTHTECNRARSNDIPTGCEMVWLLAVNARLGVFPQTFAPTREASE
jgi:5-methylcytosine-specific restriction endonuclease McrA